MPSILFTRVEKIGGSIMKDSKDNRHYNAAYINIWLKFDDMHMKQKQAEVDGNEIELKEEEVTLPDNTETNWWNIDKMIERDASFSFDEIMENQSLANAFRRLSSVERQVVDYSFRRQLNQEEISRIMGVSQSNISKISSRAKKKLKKFLLEQKME
jgi:RNA polymerase sigma factor (sigma-70 family)